jgi:hypothetical protein
MNLENVKWDNPAQKDKYHMILFIYEIQKSRTYRSRECNGGYQGLGYGAKR